jgi:SapC
MTKQLLIYNTAVPVSRQRHGDAFLEATPHFGFSSGINSVPLTAVEFPMAVRDYPIVFAGNAGEITPAVILGLRGDQNLFLTPELGWAVRYIPAFIRRYPFVFSRNDDRFLLCVDEQYEGFNKEGRGQRFFTPEGEPGPFVNTVMAFLQEYQNQFQRTQSFCARIEQLGLLEPMQAQVVSDGGETTMLSGFQAVSRAKLKALAADKLAELAATDELELLYLHLQSMNNFESLKDRLVAKTQAVQANQAATEPAPAG